MVDFGHSDDPRVQAQLDRLAALSVPQGRLGLETITALMDRLGNPHRKLPPVFHVAGTNGKGSTCAFLRAMLEADGKRVHVTTSPHLVRYNERIRIAGKLIEDGPLAQLLEEVLDASQDGGEDLAPSFFEVTIAAAFLAFSRTPADACVVEVGLGGRFDATNVLEPEALAACGIAALGLDHERFLLAPEEGVPTEPMARIAFEKAGIAKKGVPLVTMGGRYPHEARAAIADYAERASTRLFEFGQDWAAGFERHSDTDWEFYFSQGSTGRFAIPELALGGHHQLENAGLAISMLLRQDKISVSQDALVTGAGKASWPARFQLLSSGPLTDLAKGRRIIVDGGHNPSAGKALAGQLVEPVYLILGMLANKDPSAIVDAIGGEIWETTIVPVPGHESHTVDAFHESAKASPNLVKAIKAVPSMQKEENPFDILIAGSLYLAGEALRLNDEVPD
ncbi:MAG: folylpolyglutamate synthase/dihydrofolate synthase family protein [Pseudomonadota bacterium]